MSIRNGKAPAFFIALRSPRDGGKTTLSKSLKSGEQGLDGARVCPSGARRPSAAEAAGIEALVPVARWRGFGGATNFNHRSFETLTWAATSGRAALRGAVSYVADHVGENRQVCA
jgi:hypothetical protein